MLRTFTTVALYNRGDRKSNFFESPLSQLSRIKQPLRVLWVYGFCSFDCFAGKKDQLAVGALLHARQPKAKSDYAHLQCLMDPPLIRPSAKPCSRRETLAS